MNDASPGNAEANDFLRFKKTVPLSFFYGSVDPQLLPKNDSIIGHHSEIGNKSLRTLYLQSGATEFGTVVAEAHLNRAKKILAKLEERLGPLVDLNRHVETLEHNP